MKRILFIGLLFGLCGFGETAPDAPQILQIKQSFEPSTLSVSANASVDFVNMDDVNHNIQITDPKGGRADLGVEHAGESSRYSFAGPGLYTVACGIHPRMKAKVIVQ